MDGIDWIRLLYLYPSAISDELIAAIAAAERVLPYVDVPLQHASDPMTFFAPVSSVISCSSSRS